MKSFKKINSKDIKVGMRFSAPVFFDDGENMFLAEGKSAKPYHIAALSRWEIPFLLTYGHLVSAEPEPEKVDELEELSDVEDIEPAEDLESADSFAPAAAGAVTRSIA